MIFVGRYISSFVPCSVAGAAYRSGEKYCRHHVQPEIRTSIMPNKLRQAKSLIQDLAGYSFRDENILLDALDTTGLLRHSRRLVPHWYPERCIEPSLRKCALLRPYSGAGNDHVSSIGSNANLAAAARLHGIEACVLTNPGHRGPVSQATLSTTVEAIIGAVYLDSEKNLDAVRTFMEALGLTILGTGNVPAQTGKTLTAAFCSRALDSMLRFARYRIINARHAITSYRILDYYTIRRDCNGGRVEL
ncbi:hypothetical protein KC363_g169 [Hortaea werneckii]|nr:hypothetical protein KC363_g169 [Hortaea werneckii]